MEAPTDSENTPLRTGLDMLVDSAVRAVTSLSLSVCDLEPATAERAAIEAAVERGHFRPDEEGLLQQWFARFLSVRGGLWETIYELYLALGEDWRSPQSGAERRCFLLGYASACLLVRMDRFLTETVATHTITQRKLNEAAPRNRIPRKQFTRVLKSMADPGNARLMDAAMKRAERDRRWIVAMSDCEQVGEIADQLSEWESWLVPGKRRYLRRVIDYLDHALRRRGASAQQQSVFAVLEASGRMVAELRVRWRRKRVSPATVAAMEKILQPGDVLVTRHDGALSNLFLPGFWPHAALHIGTEEDRLGLGVNVDAARSRRWCGDIRVLEARKDGVLLRPLRETLAVDAVVVIRPRLDEAELKLALEKALSLEGMMYNFDFDFFRADRLVCTEVVYRAMDGIGEMHLPLKERAGRRSLSAEDLLDLAVEGKLFEPVALFGVPGCRRVIVTGAAARQLLINSYRPAS